ncbi:MAG: hypothetical protein WA888_04435 [Burkholderiaceae bacterium]
MKQIELLKLSDQSWIRKREGFRIRCLRCVDESRVEVLMPAESELPMDSEIVAWRVAFKLSQSTEAAADGQPMYSNITVVDDLGEAIAYYVTGELQFFNEG